MLGVFNAIEHWRPCVRTGHSDIGDHANVEIEAMAPEKRLGVVVKASDTGLSERIQRTAGSGVVFAARENGMYHQHVSKAALFPFNISVDSGAAELIRKQGAGWVYIKAGQ